MIETVQVQASSRRSGLAAVATTLGLLAILVAWLSSTSTGTLREQLKLLQPWWLDACVLGGLVIAVLLFSALRPVVLKRDAVRLTALAALGVGLTLFVAPRTNRIFYDEQIYQGIGQNLADLRLAQVCHDGSVEYGRLRCASGDYNKQPYAYPHVLSLAFRLVGVHDWTAFAVNALVMAVTCSAVYLLAWILFRDRAAALFSGLLIALTPQQLMWSATAAVEPSASLALVLLLVCAGCYWRYGILLALYATACAAAYAVQFRPESLLMLPVVGFLVWPRLQADARRPAALWAFVVFLALVVVHVAHLYSIRHVDWGTVGPRFSIRYLPENLRVNGPFYLYDERFPVTFTLLAAAGLLAGGLVRQSAAMAFYFLAFFGVGLVFYAGSYNYGADVRYSLMTYPPLAVLGGLGAARLAGAVSRHASRLGSGQVGVPVVVTLLLFQFLWYAPVVRATTEEAWAARADVRFAHTFAASLPSNAFVLTHNPSMFHLWGVNAAQMSRVMSNQAYLRFLAERYQGGIFLHWNFWCNVQDPVHVETCRAALASVPGEVVSEYRDRDQRFAFYRLQPANP